MDPEAKGRDPLNDKQPEPKNPLGKPALGGCSSSLRIDLLAQSCIQEIQRTHAVDFVRDGEELLGDIAHFVEASSVWHDQFIAPVHRQSPFQERGCALHTRLKVLVPAGLNLIDSLSEALAQSDKDAIGEAVLHRLYPYLETVRELVGVSANLKREVAQKWLEDPPLEPRDRVASDVWFHLEKRVFELNARLASFHRNHLPLECCAPLGPIVVASLLNLPRSKYVGYEGLSHEFAFPEGDTAINMPVQELIFVVRHTAIAVRQAISDMNDEIASFFEAANRLDEVKPADFETSKPVALLKHLYLDEHDPEVTILLEGRVVRFSYEFMPGLKEAWAAKAEALRSNLGTISKICATYGGSVSIGVSNEPTSISVELTFAPAKGRQSEFHASEYFINSLRKPYRTDDSPALKLVTLPRTVQIPGIGIRRYEVEFPAAAILSEQALGQLQRALRQTDRLIGILPHFERVSMGSRGAYRGEEVQSALEAGLMSSDFSPAAPMQGSTENRAFLLERVNRAFEWEVGPREWERLLDKVISQREDPQSRFENRSLSLGPGLLFDEHILGQLSRLARRATLIQLSLDHPDVHQERVLRRYKALVVSFLSQLEQVLERARGELKVETPKVCVGCYVRMRVSDAGKSDKVFFVEIFDGQNNEICRGDFHAQDSTLKYKFHNPAILSAILSRMGGFLGRLVSKPKPSFRDLDQALAQAGVELPEDFIFALKDGVSEGATPQQINKVVEDYLSKPDTRIDVGSDKISVSSEELNATLQGQAYGIITQVDGNHPEEVCDLDRAIELYEQGDPFFTPTERFLAEYRPREDEAR